MRFLAELYVARSDLAAALDGAARARVAAEQMTSEGTPVACLQSLLVPEDETCFYVFEAVSAAAVNAAASRAGMVFDRLAEAISTDLGQMSA